MELPFTTLPQLPIKHSNVNVFYGVGVDTVYEV